jgi:phosphatidylglycerophosphate synthase
MNLHRASHIPDWEQIPQEKRNSWQKAAAATGGIATPANCVTLLGLLLVFFGLWLVARDEFLGGAFVLATGRLCDIADGWMAAVTGTKSSFGEAFDAVADKVGTFLTLLVFFVAAVAPRWAIFLLVLPQLIGSVVILLYRRRQIRLHPTRAAKTGMALAWISLLGFTLARGTDLQSPNPFTVLAGILAGISVLLSTYAIAGYVRGRS